MQMRGKLLFGASIAAISCGAPAGEDAPTPEEPIDVAQTSQAIERGYLESGHPEIVALKVGFGQ